MNVIGKARQLEAVIARRFHAAAQRVIEPRPPEPLEILHALLDAVEDEVQPAGRGTYVFPFNRLKVSLVAANREAKARYEAVFDETPTLQDRILERLHAVGCQVSDLSVKTGYLSHRAADWIHPQFHIEFARGAAVVPIAVSAPELPRLELAVIAGTASALTFSFVQPRIDLGRCEQVRDRGHRLIRTNTVAFVDGESAVNDSVSRCHGHIAHDASSRSYRIHDDRSAHGTSVLRSGRTLVVSPGARGVRLQSGDEIMLGEARLRVTIAAAP